MSILAEHIPSKEGLRQKGYKAYNKQGCLAEHIPSKEGLRLVIFVVISDGVFSQSIFHQKKD